MTKKKTAKKKNNRRASQKSKKTDYNLPANLLKALAGLLILLLLVVFTAFLAHQLFPLSGISKPGQTAPRKPVTRQHDFIKPAFEIFPKDESSPAYGIPEAAMREGMPVVAIIIDDLGYDSRIARKFVQLDAKITFSILPLSPQQKKIAELANQNGMEVMLHLPMEPSEYPEVNPGPGVLLVSMSPDTLLGQLKTNLDSMSFIKGVNNHMGSKMTTVSSTMYQIFSVLKKRDLFFVDSRTTKESLCKPSAKLLKIHFGERDVFLDHIVEPDSIRKQIKQLLRIAARQGEAIGIAHPHQKTYKVLKEELPKIKASVRLVPASSIVRIVGL
ncbi:MAG: divergent polysaccharide deacetylase family protein [Deltaproteobacteria bacterium]|nr:divergent polysaccharide deacetylase family protein [Deltaproteobacteria bacterium]